MVLSQTFMGHCSSGVWSSAVQVFWLTSVSMTDSVLVSSPNTLLYGPHALWSATGSCRSLTEGHLQTGCKKQFFRFRKANAAGFRGRGGCREGTLLDTALGQKCTTKISRKKCSVCLDRVLLMCVYVKRHRRTFINVKPIFSYCECKISAPFLNQTK